MRLRLRLRLLRRLLPPPPPPPPPRTQQRQPKPAATATAAATTTTTVIAAAAAAAAAAASPRPPLAADAPLCQRLHIRPEARKPAEQLVVHLEDALEVARHRLRLHAEPRVRRDAHAVLARHGNDVAAVVLHDRLRAARWTE
jgi:hypothetical protein